MKLNLTNCNTLMTSSPQEAFNKLTEETCQDIPLAIRVISIIGWENIASQIINYRHQIDLYDEGLTLCAFCINVLLENDKARISKKSLDLGTECLKSLLEYLYRHNTVLDEERKSKSIQWGKAFLDIWKDYITRCLEHEEQLIA